MAGMDLAVRINTVTLEGGMKGGSEEGGKREDEEREGDLHKHAYTDMHIHMHIPGMLTKPSYYLPVTLTSASWVC